MNLREAYNEISRLEKRLDELKRAIIGGYIAQIATSENFRKKILRSFLRKTRFSEIRAKKFKGSACA